MYLFSSMCCAGNTRPRCRWVWHIFTFREMVYLLILQEVILGNDSGNARSSSFPVTNVSQILTLGTLASYFQENISINVLKVHIGDDSRSARLLSAGDWDAFLLLNWCNWRSTPMTQDVSLFLSCCFFTGFSTEEKKFYWSLSNLLYSHKAGWLFYSWWK